MHVSGSVLRDTTGKTMNNTCSRTSQNSGSRNAKALQRKEAAWVPVTRQGSFVSQNSGECGNTEGKWFILVERVLAEGRTLRKSDLTHAVTRGLGLKQQGSIRRAEKGVQTSQAQGAQRAKAEGPRPAMVHTRNEKYKRSCPAQRQAVIVSWGLMPLATWRCVVGIIQ